MFMTDVMMMLSRSLSGAEERNSLSSLSTSAGMGVTKHKFLEMSNVSVVNEMVQMIVAQRAYEFNSKAIQTSDSMLSTAVNLKR